MTGMTLLVCIFVNFSSLLYLMAWRLRSGLDWWDLLRLEKLAGQMIS